jgi:hypothetical protein
MAAALGGCLSDVTASSRTYLGPAGSGVISSHPIDESALEVTRLFELRGYALADQFVDAPNGERRLKFAKTNRLLAAEKDDSELTSGRDVGSVFYAWVGPDGTGAGSRISLLGKPTLAGVEPCTNDGVVLMCSQLTVNTDLATRYLSAHTEADVVHGVISELQLEGYVVSAMPADAPLPTPDAVAVNAAAQAASDLAACHARKHAAALAAGREHDPDKHQALVREIPTCADDTP